MAHEDNEKRSSLCASLCLMHRKEVSMEELEKEVGSRGNWHSEQCYLRFKLEQLTPVMWVEVRYVANLAYLHSIDSAELLDCIVRNEVAQAIYRDRLCEVQTGMFRILSLKMTWDFEGLQEKLTDGEGVTEGSIITRDEVLRRWHELLDDAMTLEASGGSDEITLIGLCAGGSELLFSEFAHNSERALKQCSGRLKEELPKYDCFIGSMIDVIWYSFPLANGKLQVVVCGRTRGVVVYKGVWEKEDFHKILTYGYVDSSLNPETQMVQEIYALNGASELTGLLIP